MAELNVEIKGLFENAIKEDRKNVKVGINEVVKSIERGQAKFVIYANNVSPKEIVAKLPYLCKEKGVPCVELSTKEELGSLVGLKSASSISLVNVPKGLEDKLNSLKEQLS